MEFFFALLIYAAFASVLIYGIVNPRKSFMLGRRWQYNNEVEPSDLALFIHRIIAIVLLLILTLIMLT